MDARRSLAQMPGFNELLKQELSVWRVKTLSQDNASFATEMYHGILAPKQD